MQLDCSFEGKHEKNSAVLVETLLIYVVDGYRLLNQYTPQKNDTDRLTRKLVRGISTRKNWAQVSGKR